MDDNEKRGNFWLGNVLLAIALVMLLYMNTLWEIFGAVAMGLWIAVVAAGAYFLMYKKS